MLVPLEWLREWLDLPQSPSEIADLLTSIGLEVDAILGYRTPIDGVVIAQISAADPHPNAERLTVVTVNDGTTQHQIVCGDRKGCRVGAYVALAKIGTTLSPDFTIKSAKLRGVTSCGMLCSLEELGYEAKSEGIVHLYPEVKGEIAWESRGESVCTEGCSEGSRDDVEKKLLGSSAMHHLNRPVFEVSLTPNLGHCYSVKGVAREVAGKLNVSLKAPSHWKNLLESPAGASAEVPKSFSPQEVSLSAALNEAYTPAQISCDGCYHYAQSYVELSVPVGKLPGAHCIERRERRWLEAAGMRGIDPIVDATNFIMMELGHPVHAFDADKLVGQLCVRYAREGESVTTLDGVTRTLNSRVLVISDDEKVVAVAGVMGADAAKVDASTQRLLLEVAYFCPSAVRYSSRSLGLSSESSKRFERGIDRLDSCEVMASLQYLITRVDPKARYSPILMQKHPELPPLEAPSVIVSPRKLRALLGMELSTGMIEEILGRWGVVVTRLRETDALQRKSQDSPSKRVQEVSSAGSCRENRCEFGELACAATNLESLPESQPEPVLLHCKAPSWRHDLDDAACYSEEVLKALGIEEVKISAPRARPDKRDHDPMWTVESQLRARLASRGFREIITPDLIDAGDVYKLAPSVDWQLHLAKVLKPSHQHMNSCRPHMLLGLLDACASNHAHGMGVLSHFEIGSVYSKACEEAAVDELKQGTCEQLNSSQPLAGETQTAKIPSEREYLEKRVVALLMTLQGPRSWDGAAPSSRTFYDLQGEVVALAAAYGLEVELVSSLPQVESACKGLGKAFEHSSTAEFLHPGQSLILLLEGVQIGWLGRLHPRVEADWGVEAFVAQVDLAPIAALLNQARRTLPLPKYPVTARDWTLTLAETISYEEIRQNLKRLLKPAEEGASDATLLSSRGCEVLGSSGGIVVALSLISVYRSSYHVENSCKNITLRLTYRSGERSLQQEEVDALNATLRGHIEKALNELSAIDR